MTLEEANALVDQLNDVFAGKSQNIPSAEKIYEALEVFNATMTERGCDAKPIPETIKRNEVQINGNVASQVEAIRAYANIVVRQAELKGDLEKQLSKKSPSVAKKFKL
jgi:hypothetical protein